MWILPLLVLGAIAIAVSRSPREVGPPPLALAPPGAPGPISVMGEFLRVGQVPPPPVILCAIAEAESLGREDLASDIVQAFVVPVVYQHAMLLSCAPRAALAPLGQPARAVKPSLPAAPPRYERGSCGLSRSSRSPRESGRGSGQEFARAHPAASPPQPSLAMPASPPPRPIGIPSTDEGIRAMLNADPQGFFEMVKRGGAPVIDVPVEAQAAVPQASFPMSSAAVAPSSTAHADALADQLLQLPGHVGAGVTLVDPSTTDEIFEVRWLRGYPVPQLPEVIDGRPVRLVIVDDLPVAQHVAADQTSANAIGSPIAGISDDAWREFARRLEREAPTFSSSRHVGQYRQRRERLAELGVDPSAMGSARAQRIALDADLANAHHHAVESGLVAEHVGRPIAVPGREGAETLTLSGMLGVIQCAGLDGAVGWLERPGDRKRYPHTTQAFQRTNGVF